MEKTLIVKLQKGLGIDKEDSVIERIETTLGVVFNLEALDSNSDDEDIRLLYTANLHDEADPAFLKTLIERMDGIEYVELPPRRLLF